MNQAVPKGDATSRNRAGTSTQAFEPGTNDGNLR